MIAKRFTDRITEYKATHGRLPELEDIICFDEFVEVLFLVNRLECDKELSAIKEEIKSKMSEMVQGN